LTDPQPEAPIRRDLPAVVTVYEPHRNGLPPLLSYFRATWRRRQFAVHLARTSLRARHYDTVLGQLWTVANPIFLALIYYLLIAVILGAQTREGYLPFLLSGLFAFYFTRNAAGLGAASVISSGRLLMNASFPRILLPISSVVAALLMYMPMLIVYAAIHVITGQKVGPQLLLTLPILAVHALLNLGIAMFLGAATVYFRDTSSLLPYALRVWLYLSPVLYAVQDVPDRIRPFLALNPLYSLLGAWHAVLIDGRPPSLTVILAAIAWAVAAVVVGGWFFLSREREFAVRL
jgi:ABC-type polysaccharide/polyol phosphate export permease